MKTSQEGCLWRTESEALARMVYFQFTVQTLCICSRLHMNSTLDCLKHFIILIFLLQWQHAVMNAFIIITTIPKIISCKNKASLHWTFVRPWRCVLTRSYLTKCCYAASQTLQFGHFRRFVQNWEGKVSGFILQTKVWRQQAGNVSLPHPPP